MCTHKPHKHAFASFFGLFVILILMLLSALWKDTVGGHVLYAAGAHSTLIPIQPVSSLPTPTPTPYPTPQLTPAPFDTRVRVENVRAVPQALVPVPSYTTREGSVGEGDAFRSTLFVDDPVTGRSVRLGDDSGYASLWIAYPERLLWVNSCSPCPTLKPGTYLYDVKADTNTLVLPSSMNALFPKLYDNWLVYPRWTKGYSASYSPMLPLMAYNFNTQQEITLTKELPFPMSNPGTFAVGSGIAVWSEWWGPLTMRDFATGVTKPVLAEGGPTYISGLAVNDGVITWLDDEGWQGFDLATGSHFRIPYSAPGWAYGDNVSQYPVHVQGNRLMWEMRSYDGDLYYYMADLVRDAVATPAP